MGRSLLIVGIVILTACASAPQLPEIPERGALKLDVSVDRVYGQLVDSPMDPESNGAVARVLHRLGQYPEAELLYRRAHALDRRSAEWLYLLGRVQGLQENLSAAVGSLRQSLLADPGYIPAQLLLAEYYLRSGDLVQGAAAFRQLAGDGPSGAIASMGLGRIALGRGDEGEALRHFNAACNLEPMYGRAHYALGLVYKSLNQAAESERHFVLAQRHRLDEPALDDPLLRRVYGENYRPVDYLRAGEEALYREQPSKAADAFRQALALDPHRVEAHVGLIRAYGSLNHTERAEEHYREALASDETNDQLHFHYAALLLEENRFQEARQQLLKALEVNPYYGQALAHLGYMAEKDRQFQEAAAKYRAALSYFPGYRPAHLRLGGLLLRDGKLDEAGRQFRLALEKEDEHRPRYLYQASQLYARNGSPSRADAYLAQANEEAKQYGLADLKTHAEQTRRPLE